MPNGHDYSKEYGPHKYEDGPGTYDCEHGCGCWAGPTRSGGPLGIDPLYGECPKNPKDGKLVGGDVDHEIVVERRIRALESTAFRGQEAMNELKRAKKGTKTNLVQRLGAAEVEINRLQGVLGELRGILESAHSKALKGLSQEEALYKFEEEGD